MRTKHHAFQIGNRVELTRDVDSHQVGERGTVKSLFRSAKDDTVVQVHVQFDTAPPGILADTDPSAVKKVKLTTVTPARHTAPGSIQGHHLCYNPLYDTTSTTTEKR